MFEIIKLDCDSDPAGGRAFLLARMFRVGKVFNHANVPEGLFSVRRSAAKVDPDRPGMFKCIRLDCNG
jgi:hypothetical protein